LKLVVAGSVVAAGHCDAAIFRIQDSTWNYNPSNPSDSGACYQTGCISGDFHINTDYKDANGNVVNVSPNTITEWNVRVSGIGGSFTFANGGSQTASYNDVSKIVSFSDGGGTPKTLSFGFGVSILNQLGNTIDATGGSSNDKWYEPIVSITSSVTAFGSVDANGAQVDFVPFAPLGFSLLPALSAALGLKKTSKIITD
jgi:hypothetical protein